MIAIFYVKIVYKCFKVRVPQLLIIIIFHAKLDPTGAL